MLEAFMRAFKAVAAAWSHAHVGCAQSGRVCVFVCVEYIKNIDSISYKNKARHKQNAQDLSRLKRELDLTIL